MCEYKLPGVPDEIMQQIFDYRLPKAVELSAPFHDFCNEYKVVFLNRIDQNRDEGLVSFVRVDVEHPNQIKNVYYFRI